MNTCVYCGHPDTKVIEYWEILDIPGGKPYLAVGTECLSCGGQYHTPEQAQETDSRARAVRGKVLL